MIDKEKDETDLLETAEAAILEPDLFQHGCFCFMQAKAYNRLWQLYEQNEEKPAYQLEALTFLYDDPQSKERAEALMLDLAKKIEKTNPDLALTAIGRLNESKSVEAETVLRTIAETARLSNALRVELNALLIMDIDFEEESADKTRLQEVVDAFENDTETLGDGYAVAEALELLGHNTKASMLRKSLDHSQNEMMFISSVPDGEIQEDTDDKEWEDDDE